ncbi:zeta toxin family protein [Roseimicrobium sp. ORNL1]|uniref:zeta toxin family protein n=1 Tax=Roseimicrobium sp. ORNL1 TaxID=2711231 RepID=UPI0013E1B704|nr:zeta toxin family protein [Roseimicrobium sp. ORNL1]QIF03356.1 hypothetical protein G5S37_18105 [Roseimicrobium sp. ORNL1]
MDSSDAAPINLENQRKLVACAWKQLEDALSRSEETAARLASELHPEFLRAVDEDAMHGYSGLPGLVPAASLTRMERVVEARFAQLIAVDLKGAVEQYLALAREDFGSDCYVNADLALSLFPEYARDHEFRTIFHRATYAPVSHLTRRLAIPQILRRDRKGRPLGLLLAGGPSSGKTTVSKGALKTLLDVTSIIVDSNLATMARGIELISAAIEQGLRPQVIFIYSPMYLVERFVLRRLRKNGRPISANTLADNHHEAQVTFLKLEQMYRDRADFLVFVNEGKPEEIEEKSLEFLRERSYASQGENGSKQLLAQRFREHVIREWLRGNLTTVETLASGWSAVGEESLRKLEEGADRIRKGERRTEATA